MIHSLRASRMPSDPPQRGSKARCSSRKAKPSIRGCIGEEGSPPPFLVASPAPSGSSESEAEERKASQSKRQKPVMVWKKKIRVICTDPDATDSSSDDDEGGGGGGGMAMPKRLVREILIPSHCCAFPWVVSESSLHSSSSSSDGYGRGFSFLPVKEKEEEDEHTAAVSGKKSFERGKEEDSPSPPGCAKKSSSSSRRISKAHVVSAGKRGAGEAQRQGGKWSAEARYPWEGIRLWLGPIQASSAARSAPIKTSSSPLSQQQDMPELDQSANPNPNPNPSPSPKPIPNPRLGNASSSCSPASLRCLSAGEDAEDGGFSDRPNAGELGFIIRSSIHGDEESVVEPFSSSCYSLCFGSLSPSSVLENSDCGSPALLNADDKASCCTVADACIKEAPTAPIPGPMPIPIPPQSDFMANDMALCKDGRSGHASQMKLESPYSVLLSAHPLLEESQYYSDLSQVFNARRSEGDQSLDHHLDAELFAGDAGFGDMDFDIETETLAWINVAGV